MADYTVAEALTEIERTTKQYAVRIGNYNQLALYDTVMARLQKKFGKKLTSSEPKDLAALLQALPTHFTTRYRDSEIPTYCGRYALTDLNKVARKLAKAAGVKLG